MTQCLLPCRALQYQHWAEYANEATLGCGAVSLGDSYQQFKWW